MSSKKRKLQNCSEPPSKRQKINDDEKDKEMSIDYEETIKVILNDNESRFSRSSLMNVQFCRAKLQRWTNNDKIINLTGYPKIKALTFKAIVTIKQFLCNPEQEMADFITNDIEITDDKKFKIAAKLLLQQNITIDDLPSFIEACSILTEQEILNEKLFEYYFNQHEPISAQKYQEIKSKITKNNRFTAEIINNQIENYNVMNNYSMHKKVYDRCNTLKKIHFSLPGAQPKAIYAQQYIIECLDDHMRVEIHRYGDESKFPFIGNYNDYNEDHWHNHGTFRVNRNDYGVIMAFDDMIKYQDGICINDFLQTYFQLALLDNIGTQKTFCFYGLAYIANELWKLYLMKHNDIKKYVDQILNGYKVLYKIYDKISKHKSLNEYKKYYHNLTGFTDCKEYYQQIGINLEKQRIKIGLEYKHEWNEIFMFDEINQFPNRINLNEFRTLDDAQWLIDNFAFKVQHSNCMKILRRSFDICYSLIDKYTIPDTLNNIFQQYLGVKIQQ